MTNNVKRAGAAGSRGQMETEKPDFELLFRSLFENMDNGAALHRVVRGSDGKPTDYLCEEINPRCLEMLGLKREDVVGYPASAVYGMDTAPYLEEFGTADASGHPFGFDTYFARTDRHFDISVIPLGRDYFATIFNDISERRRQEEHIRRNESSLRALLENMPNQAWLKDTESHLLAANSRYAVNCGRQTVEELLGKTDLELWPRELAEKYMADDAKVVAGGKSIHFEEMIDIVGKRLWFETFKTPVFDQDGKPIGTAGMALEITERKRTEVAAALNARYSQALLQLNQMTDATLQEITNFTLEEAVRLTQSTIGYLAFLNEDESVLTMHSWSKNAMAECAIADKPFKYPVVSTGLWGEAVRQRRAIITNDYAADNPWKKGIPQGHVGLKRHMNVPVFEGAHIVIVAGVGNKVEEYHQDDVDHLTLLMEGMWRMMERKRVAEELRRHREHLEELVEERTAELRANEESLRLILNSLPDAVFIHEPDGTIVVVNHKMVEMYGLADPAAAVGLNPLQFSAPEADMSAVRACLDRAMRGEDVHFEWQALAPSTKRVFNAEVYLRRITYRGVPRILASVHDITDRKKAEAALARHAQELAVLNKSMTGREMRIIELKQEVNALCRELGRPPVHPPVWKEEQHL